MVAAIKTLPVSTVIQTVRQVLKSPPAVSGTRQGPLKKRTGHFAQGTIRLRRRQIFTIFDPHPPTIGIPAKCLWRRFLILMYCDLLTIGTWGHPSPPKTCWRLKWMVPIVKIVASTIPTWLSYTSNRVANVVADHNDLLTQWRPIKMS